MVAKVSAIVLAGGEVSGSLATVTSERYEALIPIGSQSMVSYVISALRSSERVGRIIVVGPAELAGVVSADSCEFVDSTSSMVENLVRALSVVGPAEKVLVVTGDVPLVTGAVIDRFLEQTEPIEADIYYPIITKESNEALFPHIRRTYVRLREGVFTGGNVVLLDPDCVLKCRQTIEQAVAMRKKPWQLARLLGFRFILKLLLNQLHLAEIEKRVELILGFKGKGIISTSPEIGIDVDKASDLQLVQSVLAGEYVTPQNVKSENAPGTIDA